MIILIIIFDSHLYTRKQIVFTLFALFLVLFVSFIRTVIFVGKVSNSTSIYVHSSQTAVIIITAPYVVIGRLVR